MEKIFDFKWYDKEKQNGKGLNDEERYNLVVQWAVDARGRNPLVFDNLTKMMLDDQAWVTDEQILENKRIFIDEVLARFKEQNSFLRGFIQTIKGELVNEAVYSALDNFDRVLIGDIDDENLKNSVIKVLADFSYMKDKNTRRLIGGSVTGPTGTDSADVFGYVNILEIYDAQIQWALFMPGIVKKQQNGFCIDSFEYLSFPNLRFIGFEGEEYEDIAKRKAMFGKLDNLNEYKASFNYDMLLFHFNGAAVDVGKCHGVWGRFYVENTIAPEGFIHYDFVVENDNQKGLPYLSQFAFAKFSGDMLKMHGTEGYDVNAMYDVTRNIILAKNDCIPYPDKYWTAEVFLKGVDKDSTGYLFSIIK